jgi:hypothetical protein
MKHTPEPWAISSIDPFLIVDRHGNDVAAALSMYSAARIVACVNACKGMENPETVIKGLREAVKTALKEFKKISDNDWEEESAEKAKKAIVRMQESIRLIDL